MNKKMKELIDNLLYLLGIVCVALLIITFVGQRTNVDGSSMEPMLTDGDNLIVDKLTYRFRDPERFDVIIFPVEQDHNKKYIKRIIGLPGETVQIDKEGNIYINGEILEENYGRETINPDTIGRAAEPVVLGENEYFVLGDNRNHSSDSRRESVGNVSRDDIIGRAWARIWPLNKACFIKHQ